MPAHHAGTAEGGGDKYREKKSPANVGFHERAFPGMKIDQVLFDHKANDDERGLGLFSLRPISLSPRMRVSVLPMQDRRYHSAFDLFPWPMLV